MLWQAGQSVGLRLVNPAKIYILFQVVENKMQQCSRGSIVPGCQQYYSILLNLNQLAIRCNNAEQYC